jgi:hypothetical protein
MIVCRFVAGMLLLVWATDAFSHVPLHIQTPLGPKIVTEPASCRSPLVLRGWSALTTGRPRCDSSASLPDQGRLVEPLARRYCHHPRSRPAGDVVAKYGELKGSFRPCRWRVTGSQGKSAVVRITAAQYQRLKKAIFQMRRLWTSVLRWASSAQHARRGIGRRVAVGALLVALTFPTVVQPAWAYNNKPIRAEVERFKAQMAADLLEWDKEVQSLKDELKRARLYWNMTPVFAGSVGFLYLNLSARYRRHLMSESRKSDRSKSEGKNSDDAAKSKMDKE